MTRHVAILLSVALMWFLCPGQVWAASGGKGKPAKADKEKPDQPDRGKPDDRGGDHGRPDDPGKPDDPGGGHGKPDPDDPGRGKPDHPGGDHGKPENPGGGRGKPDRPDDPDRGKPGGERGKPDHPGKDKGKPDGGGDKGPKDRPPGWDKGQKRGWDDIYPPGWDKKTDADRERWRRDVDLGRDDVARTAEVYGVTDEDKGKHQDAFEVLVRKGKELEKAREDTIEGIKKGKKAMDVLKENGITIEL